MWSALLTCMRPLPQPEWTIMRPHPSPPNNIPTMTDNHGPAILDQILDQIFSAPRAHWEAHGRGGSCCITWSQSQIRLAQVMFQPPPPPPSFSKHLFTLTTLEWCISANCKLSFTALNDWFPVRTFSGL